MRASFGLIWAPPEGMADTALPPGANEISRTISRLGGNAPRLVIENLSTGYGRTEIVHAIDLRLAPAQCLCLIGPNGAGKSTVLNAVFGFADVFGGSAKVDGEDVTHLAPDRKLERGIG